MERQKKDIGKRKDKGKQPLLWLLLPLHKISLWLDSLSVYLTPTLPPPLPHASARCSSYPRVAALVIWMNSCSIVAPFGVKRRECNVVSLVIPACRLSSWYSLQPRSRCLTTPPRGKRWSIRLRTTAMPRPKPRVKSEQRERDIGGVVRIG